MKFLFSYTPKTEGKLESRENGEKVHLFNRFSMNIEDSPLHGIADSSMSFDIDNWGGSIKPLDDFFAF